MPDSENLARENGIGGPFPTSRRRDGNDEHQDQARRQKNAQGNALAAWAGKIDAPSTSAASGVRLMRRASCAGRE
jgi:hypothetical protein